VYLLRIQRVAQYLKLKTFKGKRAQPHQNAYRLSLGDS